MELLVDAPGVPWGYIWLRGVFEPCSSDRLPEPRVHPGRDWFYVLDGTVRLRLGDREILVEAGQAASFDTMTPHSMVGHGGGAEVLTILDHHGERAHLREA